MDVHVRRRGAARKRDWMEGEPVARGRSWELCTGPPRSRSVLTLRGLSENRALGDGASHHSPSSCSIVTGHSDLALDSASQVVAHVHGEVVVKRSSTANFPRGCERMRFGLADSAHLGSFWGLLVLVSDSKVFDASTSRLSSTSLDKSS